jgi:predicted Rossmann fold flavoprotein
MSFSKMQSSWDVIIIGGGAAGLWAAGTAAQRGRRVLVLEKNNKAGVKILMSGGTRCNITHHCDTRKIAEAFGKQGKVLLSPLSRLGPMDVIRELNQLGVETKVEETGKIFPASNRAIDVRDAIVKRLHRAGAHLWTGSPVTHVRSLLDSGVDAGSEIGSSPRFGVTATFGSTNAELTCQSVLITSGGLSFSGCGTTGDGYPWAQAFGHTITPLRPALTPLLSHMSWVHELSGLTLDDVNVTAKLIGPDVPKKLERASSRGGLLWTHFGLSGPTAMNVSRCVSDLPTEQQSLVLVDLLPNQSREECDAWLSKEIRSSHKSIVNILSQLIPRRLSQSLMKQLQLKEDVHGAEFSNKSKNQLLESLKNLTIPVHGTRGYAKAEVTAGGVALSEVNFQDMQSRKHPGLYFAGEILDLDGPIGGFNFQAAWSTGHAAGLHV